MPQVPDSSQPGIWDRATDLAYKHQPKIKLVSFPHHVAHAIGSISASPALVSGLESIGLPHGPAAAVGYGIGAISAAASAGAATVQAKGAWDQVAATARGRNGFLRSAAAVMNGGERSNQARRNIHGRDGYNMTKDRGAGRTEFNDGVQSYRGKFLLNPNWSRDRQDGWRQAREIRENVKKDEFDAWCDGAHSADPTSPTYSDFPPGVTQPEVSTLQDAPNAPPGQPEDDPTGSEPANEREESPEDDEPKTSDEGSGPDDSVNTEEDSEEPPGDGDVPDAEDEAIGLEAGLAAEADGPDPDAEPDADEADTEDQDPETEDPEADSDEPEAETEDPEADSDEPEADAEDPETEDPEADSDEPEADAEDPETEDPEADSDEPEADAEDPETEDPEADSDEPEADAEGLDSEQPAEPDTEDPDTEGPSW